MGIAQYYKLLGEGEKAYKNLNLAILEIPTKSIAYRNMGGLFVTAGLIDQAEYYFNQATEVEPQFLQNHLSRIDYYVRYKADHTGTVKNVFTDARKRTNDNISVLKRYAQWLTDQEDYILAIDMWKLVLRSNPTNIEAVQYEIDKLTEKLNGQ